MENDEINIDNYLDDILKSDPGYSLPDDFAFRISARTKKQLETIQLFKDFLLYLVTFCIVVAVLSGAGYFLKLDIFLKYVNLLSGNLYWVVGFFVIALFILFTDKVLLPYIFISRSLKK